MLHVINLQVYWHKSGQGVKMEAAHLRCIQSVGRALLLPIINLQVYWHYYGQGVKLEPMSDASMTRGIQCGNAYVFDKCRRFPSSHSLDLLRCVSFGGCMCCSSDPEAVGSYAGRRLVGN